MFTEGTGCYKMMLTTVIKHLTVTSYVTKMELKYIYFNYN